jgi:hypothetical protein
MSTFAVWGMTEDYAIKDARKKVSTWNTGNNRPRTPDEFEEAVAKKAKTTIEGKRVVQLSPKYDAPQFCHHFIELIHSGGIRSRNLCVKAQVKEKVVKITKKTKKPYKLTWIREDQFGSHKAYA